MVSVTVEWKSSVPRPKREVLEKGIVETLNEVFLDNEFIYHIYVEAHKPCRGTRCGPKIKIIPRACYFKKHPGFPVRISTQNGGSAVQCMVQLFDFRKKTLSRAEMREIFESL